MIPQTGGRAESRTRGLQSCWGRASVSSGSPCAHGLVRCKNHWVGVWKRSFFGSQYLFVVLQAQRCTDSALKILFFYCRTQGSAYKCWIKQILGQFMILAVLQLECWEDLTAHVPLHPRDIKKYLWNFVKDFLTIRYLFTTLRSIHLEGIATQFQF